MDLNPGKKGLGAAATCHSCITSKLEGGEISVRFCDTPQMSMPNMTSYNVMRELPDMISALEGEGAHRKAEVVREVA